MVEHGNSHLPKKVTVGNRFVQAEIWEIVTVRIRELEIPSTKDATRPASRLRANWLRRFCCRRKGKYLVELGVNEFDGDLNSSQAVVTSEINRALRVLKVVGFERVGGPVPKALHKQFCAYVL